MPVSLHSMNYSLHGSKYRDVSPVPLIAGRLAGCRVLFALLEAALRAGFAALGR